MVNKTDVSNQITGLRPKVKQAAVHMAHHHTKEIKKCEVRKGPKMQKFHNKAENLKKEVTFLKKIQPDNVSRYALLMDFKDREKLLGDVNLPLETKVMIKLATQKPVVSLIEEFRAQHPDWASEVPHLLETLGIRAKFKKKIQKEQEKQARKLARRQEFSQSSQSASTLESSQDDDCKPILANEKLPLKTSTKMPLLHAKQCVDESAHIDPDLKSGSDEEVDSDSDDFKSRSDEEVDSDSADLKSGSDEEVDSDSNNDDNSSIEGDIISSDNKSASSSESMSRNKDDNHLENTEENVKRKVPTNLKNPEVSKQRRKSVPNISSGSKLAEVRRFADLQKELELKGRNLKNNTNLENEELLENELSETEPVEEDTFFMTGENRYLKTAAVKRENGEGLNSFGKASNGISDKATSQWAVDGRNLKGNRAQRRAKFLGKDSRKLQIKDRKNMKESKTSSDLRHTSSIRHSNSEKDYSKTPHRNVKLSNKKSDNLSSQRGNGKPIGLKKEVSHSMPSDSGESLHPSWEAKRKMKVSLENFQGKKIKFDD